jgi:ATP-dependent DNA helicase RecQ
MEQMTWLRKEQHLALKALLRTRSVLGVLPTGFGKTLIYFLFARLRGRVIVITPLIALIQDQRERALSFGLHAYALTGLESLHQKTQLYKLWEKRKIDILFISPECILNSKVKKLLFLYTPELIVFDEAHCLIQWGEQFRGAYLSCAHWLKKAKEGWTHCSAPWLLLTGSATQPLSEKLLRLFEIESTALVIKRDFMRQNLKIEIEKVKDKEHRKTKLISKLKTFQGQASIIYCQSRSQVEYWYGLLSERFKVGFVHGGLNPEQRKNVLKSFLSGELDAVVATIAFGMGIDKPNIRAIVHLYMPLSPEDYIQAIGRGGRDGKTCDCLLLWNRYDFHSALQIAQFDSRSAKDIWKSFRGIASMKQILKSRNPSRDLSLYFSKHSASRSRA